MLIPPGCYCHHFALKLFVVITKLQQIHIYTLSHIFLLVIIVVVSLWCSRMKKKRKFYARRERNRKRWDYGMCRTYNRIAVVVVYFFPFEKFMLRQRRNESARGNFSLYASWNVPRRGQKIHRELFSLCFILLLQVYGGELEYQPASCCTTRERS